MPMAGRLTVPLVRQFVDRVVTVAAEDIATAILYLLVKGKTLAEGAGAIGVAAVLQGMVWVTLPEMTSSSPIM